MNVRIESCTHFLPFNTPNGAQVTKVNYYELVVSSRYLFRYVCAYFTVIIRTRTTYEIGKRVHFSFLCFASQNCDSASLHSCWYFQFHFVAVQTAIIYAMYRWFAIAIDKMVCTIQCVNCDRWSTK